MMIRHIPNLLSLSRIPIGIAIALAAHTGNIKLAAALFLLGALTDLTDGMLARLCASESKIGREVLEPMCDSILVAGAIYGFVATGTWQLIHVALIVGIALALQFAHQIFGGELRDLIRRHTYWMHPMFYVGVVFAVIIQYIWVLSSSPQKEFLLFGLVGGSILLSIINQRRLMQWFKGQ